MEYCDIIGKTVLCKWETLAATELYFKDRKIFHKSVEDGGVNSKPQHTSGSFKFIN